MRTLWTSSLALLLAASLVACDSGDDSESGSDGYSTDSAGDGDGDGDGDALACGEEWTEKDPMSGAEREDASGPTPGDPVAGEEAALFGFEGSADPFAQRDDAQRDDAADEAAHPDPGEADPRAADPRGDGRPQAGDASAAPDASIQGRFVGSNEAAACEARWRIASALVPHRAALVHRLGLLVSACRCFWRACKHANHALGF